MINALVAENANDCLTFRAALFYISFVCFFAISSAQHTQLRDGLASHIYPGVAHLSDDFLQRFDLGGSFEAEPLKISRQRTHLLAYDRIRIIVHFLLAK
jgi:hypothetical protein